MIFVYRLLESSIRISMRKLRCIPAYPSLLVIRFEWFVKNIPIFLVVRRFCTQGIFSFFSLMIPCYTKRNIKSKEQICRNMSEQITITCMHKYKIDYFVIVDTKIYLCMLVAFFFVNVIMRNIFEINDGETVLSDI
jgi:hypothetical protein